MLLLLFLFLEKRYSLQVKLVDRQFLPVYVNLNSQPAQELISTFVAEVIMSLCQSVYNLKNIMLNVKTHYYKILFCFKFRFEQNETVLKFKILWHGLPSRWSRN